MVTKQRDTKKYFKGKDGKVADIKRALTTRARRRKTYFKMLQEEGFKVPEKKTRSELKKTESAADREDNDDEGRVIHKKKALNFQERMALKKERKQKDRLERYQRTQTKVKEMKQKVEERKKKSELIKNAKTKKGQPLMGPRIGSLLEKIKADKGI